MNEEGYIRSVEHDLCPVCELCRLETGVRFGSGQYSRAADRLGLSDGDTWRVVFTADNHLGCVWFDSDLRQELMGDLT